MQPETRGETKRREKECEKGLRSKNWKRGGQREGEEKVRGGGNVEDGGGKRRKDGDSDRTSSYSCCRTAVERC